MNLLFLTDNYPPESNAPASRTSEHIKYWLEADKKISITVVTCVPNFPKGIAYPGYKNKFPYQIKREGRLKIIRVWSYMAANEGFLKRTLDYTSFAIMAFCVGLFLRFDTIVATSPQFFTAVSGYLLSVFKRKPWIFELRDLWPDTLKSVSAVKNSAILKWLEMIELFLYREATIIIAVTNAFKANLISRGIEESKIKVVTNGVDLSFFKQKSKEDSLLRKKLSISNQFVIGYIGTHGLTHGLQGLLKSLQNFKPKNVVFLFVGDGACKNEMKKIKDELKLNMVILHDPVSKNEIVDFWAALDMALVPLKKDPTFETVIPSKIFEAAAMKKPILLGVDGQARKIVEEFNAGLYFEPENYDMMKNKIKEVKANTSLYFKLSENCLKLANAYARQNKANQMLEIIKIVK